MPQDMSVPYIIIMGLFVVVYALLAVRLLRQILAPRTTVNARVVGKNRIEGFSKTKGSAYRYAVTFEVEGKRISFYVSEFSWNGYREGERGQLTYKGGRLLDFH